jgi:hypothetical protein
MSRITAPALSLMHHALGVTPEKRAPARNHYVASPSHYALTDLEILVSVGFMTRSTPPFGAEKGQSLFRCSLHGIAYALENLPLEAAPGYRPNGQPEHIGARASA